MKQRLHFLKRLSVLFVFFGLMVTPGVGWGQTTIFTETMGTVASTTTIATHEANNGFDNDGYAMTSGGATNPADIRETVVSSGYTGASGAANVWFTTTNAAYGYAIEGIDASAYTSLNVQFGYRKESASALPTLAIDYWNGTEYVNVPFTFNQAAVAATGWYLSPEINLPIGAQISTLRLRWVKSGEVAARIDDVILKGTPTVPTIIVNPLSLTGFTYVLGNGPSIEQTFSVSGSLLTNDISIAASNGYEISKSNGSGYTTPLTFTQTDGTVEETTVYVRLKAGLSAGSYNSELITASSTGADNKTVACSGSVTSPPLYFRSKSTGDWSSIDTWQSSGDGNTWEDATIRPTNNDYTITIRNSHTVTVNESVTIDEVIIENGGILSYTTGTLTVANGTGDDIQINNGGVLVLSFSSTIPSFKSGATCLVAAGGILRVSASGLTAAGVGVNSSNFLYQNSSILEYTLTTIFAANGVTFFPNADVNTFPVFRITNLTASPGGTNPTIINGITEANSSFTWGGSGAKTFRNGIRGTGTMSQGVNGQWIISGSTAELGGTGELSLGTNGLLINNASNVSVTSAKTISGGTVTNDGIININSDAALSISGTLTNNTIEGIILSSPASHGPAGSLIIEGGYSGSGTIKAERHILSYSASANGWHLLSSPVNNPAIAAATNLATGAQDDFYGYDEVTYEWLNYKVPGNGLTTMDNGKGFLVAYQSGSTKHMIGTPNTSSVAFANLSITSGKGNGWHLLGNPFQSAITWNSAGWNLSGIATTAKLMTNTGGFDDLDNGGIIPAMQGFWVQVVAASNTITIPTTARVHSSSNWLKSETNEKILLISNDVETGMLQKSIIRFNADATSDYDLLFDSRFMAWYAPTFYSIAGAENLSTNTLPELTDELVIPFGFKKNGSSNFSIELAETIEGKTIYLTDLKTNAVHKLSENPIYAFTSAEGDNPNRFLLHFGLVSVDEKNPVETLQAYAYNNRLYVNNSLDKAQLAVYDVQGRLLLGRQLSEGGLQSVELKMPAGVYIVRLHNSLQSKSVKIIVQ